MSDFHKQAIEIIKNKEALVFCGGGVLGIAECGALVALEELGLSMKNIKNVAGSSVGSILSTALACGCSTEYMKNMLDGLDFQRFNDNDCLLRSAVQLLTKYGLNETTEIRNIATKVLDDLVQNSNITFQELYEKTGVILTITYLSINHEATLYANYMTEPDKKVKEAMIQSSTIPLFYEAYIEGKGANRKVICDGGTLDNYPFSVPRIQGVNPNKILGLKLISNQEVNSIDNGGPGVPILDVGPPPNAIQYFVRIINMLRNQALRVHVSDKDWMISVKINVGQLSSTDFNLSKNQKDWLFDQGKQAVYNYVNELAELLEKSKYPYL